MASITNRNGGWGGSEGLDVMKGSEGVSLSSGIIYLTAGLFIAAITWAAFASVDEIARGEGKVIPSTKMQVIESVQPGVVEEILIRVGQSVDEGDIILRLDNTITESSLGEVEARTRALTAQIARFRIENEGSPGDAYLCPAEIEDVAPEICTNEANLLQIRFQSFQKGVAVLEERVEQRSRELSEAQANEKRVTEGLKLAEDELALITPLAEKNLVAQTDFIKSQREVSELQGQLASVREAISRTEAALRESKLQVDEAELQFRQGALDEMTKALAELSVYKETARGAEDRLSRTEIRAPVDGVVNSLYVTTLGTFVNAGDRIVDIVPTDDALLIEARAKPSDIAFIRAGQAANVKLTAYDFSIYGGLDGIVDQISADSIYDEATRETYYAVLVRADQAYLTYNDKEFPIFPGMIAEVEILTGKKTVLDYLLKPINKARQEALSER